MNAKNINSEYDEIKLVIKNNNNCLKYLQQCVKAYKETNVILWLDLGLNKVTYCLNELKRFEFLLDKYKPLREDFYKSKHKTEKILHEMEVLESYNNKKIANQ